MQGSDLMQENNFKIIISKAKEEDINELKKIYNDFLAKIAASEIQRNK